VHPEGWEIKGSATDFDDHVWYKTLNKALYMDELIRRHGHIMDEYDPEKQIGMIVDEWGTWYTVEPGTNPGFLYQQNTMRDALVAGITLNIFNKHSDRVKMANLAQMVNVLQSVILTDGADMILTPTYHVFDMYKYHQDAMLLDSSIETKEIGVDEEWRVPNLNESVSMDADGTIHITLTNLSLTEDYDINTILADYQAKEVTGEIVHGDMHDMNTFEQPDAVKVHAFSDVKITEQGLSFTIPKCSVLHLAVR
jgi:alpha-N-arabinofuranosidase